MSCVTGIECVSNSIYFSIALDTSVHSACLRTERKRRIKKYGAEELRSRTQPYTYSLS